MMIFIRPKPHQYQQILYLIVKISISAHVIRVFFRMTNISSSLKKNMPISINSSLPSINLYIGIPEDNEIHIRMLVDIGAIMNTGSLKYYLWVMS